MRSNKSPKTKKSPIKALTIRQPWAELILRGRKPYELRSWRTNYRGLLVIHAAAKINAENARRLGLNPEKLIAGAFVGVAILVSPQIFVGSQKASPHYSNKSKRAARLVQGSDGRAATNRQGAFC
jgi:hypothetical protein